MESFILPFRGEEVKISQGYNSPYNHNNRYFFDYSYSLDFELPVGTEVIASKSGIVRFFYDKTEEYYRGILDPKDLAVFPKKRFLGNLIEIEHEDETIASYQHLMLGSISKNVQKGQMIKQGDLIALSGLSGWIGPLKPHLHFRVLIMKWGRDKNKIKRIIKTIPIKFSDYNGPLEHLELFPKSKT